MKTSTGMAKFSKAWSAVNSISTQIVSTPLSYQFTELLLINKAFNTNLVVMAITSMPAGNLSGQLLDYGTEK